MFDSTREGVGGRGLLGSLLLLLLRLFGSGLFLLDGESSRGDELSRSLDKVLQSATRYYTVQRGERDERDLVDVREYSSTGDGSSNEGIELFISSNGELQMTRSDTFNSEILGSVTCRT